MVYTTALDKFTALTQRATAEAVAAAPAGPTESIPVGISKAALKCSMGGAIFKCDEGFFYCDPSAPACSVERADGSTELITAVSPQAARKFRKVSWLDEHVEVVAFQALLDGIWLVGGVPTTFQVPDGGSGAEATTFTELIVCSGGTPPYRMDIYDALDMATKACDGDDPSPGGAGERTPVWTPWKKRVPPPPAPRTPLRTPSSRPTISASRTNPPASCSRRLAWLLRGEGIWPAASLSWRQRSAESPPRQPP